MSENEVAALRLRQPERRQKEWVPQCTDDLVGTTHPVRTAAVVAKLDLSNFREPIKAREGVAGRDRPGAAGVVMDQNLFAKE